MKRARIQIGLVAAVLSAFFTTSTSLACTVGMISATVPSSFRVAILDFRDRPLMGVELLLLKKESEVRRLKTDSAGQIRIDGLSAGKYELKAADSADPEVLAELVVIGKARGEKQVLVLHWPRWGHISTSTLSGKLRSWKIDPRLSPQQILRQHIGGGGTQEMVAVSGVSLALFRAGATEVISQTTTSDIGAFVFPVTEPGVYVMRFKFGNYEKQIVLYLDREFEKSVSILDILVDDQIPCAGYKSLNGGE